MVTCLASWPTGPVKLEWIAGPAVDLPITGAHGFCFKGNDILLCNVAARGMSIPGGHVERGESPDACLLREAREEANAELEDLLLVGHVVADHSINPSYRGKYPVRAAQAMFVAAIRNLGEFVSSSDSSARRLVPYAALPSHHHEWNEVLAAAYAAALENRFGRR